MLAVLRSAEKVIWYVAWTIGPLERPVLTKVAPSDTSLGKGTIKLALPSVEALIATVSV